MDYNLKIICCLPIYKTGCFPVQCDWYHASNYYNI